MTTLGTGTSVFLDNFPWYSGYYYGQQHRWNKISTSEDHLSHCSWNTTLNIMLHSTLTCLEARLRVALTLLNILVQTSLQKYEGGSFWWLEWGGNGSQIRLSLGFRTGPLFYQIEVSPYFNHWIWWTGLHPRSHKPFTSVLFIILPCSPRDFGLLKGINWREVFVPATLQASIRLATDWKRCKRICTS